MIEFIFIYQNQNSDAYINDLNEFSVISNNKIDFVGYIETKNKIYFSLPNIFKNQIEKFNQNPKEYTKLCEQIIRSIIKSNRKNKDLVDIYESINKENLKKFIIAHYYKYKIPKIQKIKVNNSGKINIKKTCRYDNYIVCDKSILLEKIVFTKRNNQFNDLSILVANFLYFICDIKDVPISLLINKKWLSSDQCINNILNMLNKYNKDYEQIYLKSILFYLKNYYKKNGKFIYTKCYPLVWEIMIQEILDKNGTFEYQKSFTIGNIRNQQKNIILDHFNLEKKIIIDSKFKQSKELYKNIDYKQLIYQVFIEKYYKKSFENYIIFPSLEEETEEKFISEELELHINYIPLNFYSVINKFVSNNT